jgi:hypothetical protein
MAYNSIGALRDAGLVSGSLRPELEEFFSSLTENEVQVLVSTKNRLDAILPDVEAHSQEWKAPEATQEGFDAAMLCACGAWSGAGGASN